MTGITTPSPPLFPDTTSFPLLPNFLNQIWSVAGNLRHEYELLDITQESSHQKFSFKMPTPPHHHHHHHHSPENNTTTTTAGRRETHNTTLYHEKKRQKHSRYHGFPPFSCCEVVKKEVLSVHFEWVSGLFSRKNRFEE
ncbi:hypothetical protein L6452_01865 [Arctium lappa]|uniref:Uncharacterized protein n=1 Tax=Arctium lappa TaxID=4217 RepID=A0ACB9FH97_ARCLA|nr:hypothetical protein L6452_01865 [Arctium lappa]